MNDIMVSVCCAAFNHARYIDQAMESFLSQRTGFDFEIIVHDDASADGTAEAILRWQARYPEKIHAIIQTENQYSKGVSIIDNMLAHARGKYIAVCEGDDYWTSAEKLEKQVRYMEAHQDCSLCVHASTLVDADGKTTGMLRRYRHNCMVDMQDILAMGGRLAATSSYLYPTALRRDALPAFCRLIPGVGDNSLQMYLATRGHVYYISEPLSCYRRGHAGSWTVRTYRAGESERIAHLQASIHMYRAFDEYTGLRWHEAVQAAVTAKEIDILQAEHNFSALFRPPYGRFFRTLGLGKQLKICARCIVFKIAPNYYRKLICRGKIV